MDKKGNELEKRISVNTWLKHHYGVKVYKLALSTGCTCPNRDGTLSTGGCIFCDGAGAFAQRGDMKEQIKEAKALVSKKVKSGTKYIAYFQSFTNTYGKPPEELEKMYREAIEPEDVVAISIATRPDCLSEEMMEVLVRIHRVKPVWIELGLQTIHEQTAIYINRQYSLSVFDDAMKRLKARGMTVIVHQMLGLPGETKEMMVETSRYIGKSGADGVKLHLLHILAGTEMAREWKKGKVSVLSLEEYIAILIDCLYALPKEVILHRLTGDGQKKDLLAPLWSGDKKRVMNTVKKALEEAGMIIV
jgi:radical SAM protein, TIGR01212 family